jgi:VWFA-related protein
MKVQFVFALLLIVSVWISVMAQRPAPPLAPVRTEPRIIQQRTPDVTRPQTSQQEKTPSEKAQEEVVTITTNLVQVDVVVTDKNGRPVTDLKAEDFEVVEDGQLQPITHFSFNMIGQASTLSTAPANPTASPTDKNRKAPPPPPPVSLRPEQVQRTVALVVDDLCMSFQSTDAVRSALKKFVDEQVQPTDLVAIFRSRGGGGALQQFTSDKSQLYRAINNVHWSPSPLGYSCQDMFMTARSDYTLHPPGAGKSQTFESVASRSARERDEDYSRDIISIGTLGTLRFVLKGLEELPGRKSVVLISDGLPIFSRSGFADRTLNAMQRIINLANRASVVFYTIDVRGVVDPMMISAADEVLPPNPKSEADEIELIRQERWTAFMRSQEGLNYLAQATGGLFIHNRNDLDGGLRRALDDQSGYYLLGYRPTKNTITMSKDKFFKIVVRVKRPGLNVRWRNGFYGLTSEVAHPQPRTGDSQLYAALASPLKTGDVRVRLTSLFGKDQRTGPFMRSLLYIDAHDITFTDEPNGWKKFVLDVTAVTFGENGQIVNEFNRTHTIRTAGAAYQQILHNGLVYAADVPIKRPGAYQLRIVVRDSASKRLGSASQFIEVPDLKKNYIALSGILLSEAGEDSVSAMSSMAPDVSAEEALRPAQSRSNPAVRIFQPGSVLSYSYLIYNARVNRSAQQPQLTTQVRIFHNGQLILNSQEIPFDVSKQTDIKQPRDEGFFKLNANIAPGEYVLQLIVNDNLAGEKRQTATQWIDFEIVK